MSELVTSAPASLQLPADLARRVDEAEYGRLLGYPDRRIPAGPATETARRTREWFRRHAAPWIATRSLLIRAVGNERVELVAAGEILSSRTLARRLRSAGAEALVVALASAGREADRRSSRLWRDDRHDEAWFADRFAAAAVEHLAAWTGEHLRRTLRPAGRGLLASYAPGYPGWELAQMAILGRLLGAGFERRFEILDSGMIRPRSSMLAVFGLTRDLEAADRSWRRSGCRWCALAGCGFRRRPARRREDRKPLPNPGGPRRCC